MRAIMAFIGYVSTATVLSLAIGLGYLWQTERLDDEKVFRIIALVHDVDIEGIAAEEVSEDAQTPPEEASLEDIAGYRALVARNHEAKQDALKRGSEAFNHDFRKLKTATDHFSEVAEKIETELQSQGELASKEAVSKVVRNLELINPEQAKEQLLRTLDDPNGDQDVIKLTNAMQPGKLKKILQKFRTPEELDALHAMHRLMLSGGPQAQLMQEALQQLRTLESNRP